jgi:hypothetical protein
LPLPERLSLERETRSFEDVSLPETSGFLTLALLLDVVLVLRLLLEMLFWLVLMVDILSRLLGDFS